MVALRRIAHYISTLFRRLACFTRACRAERFGDQHLMPQPITNTIEIKQSGHDSHIDLPAEIIEQFDELNECADEEKIPRPTPAACEQAKKILRDLYRKFPRYYAIYPLGDDGGVAMQPEARENTAVMIACENSGRISIYADIDGKNRHAHYSDASNFPDEFTRDALRKTEKNKHAQASARQI